MHLMRQGWSEKQISDLLYNQLSQAPTQYLAAPIGSGDELQMTLVLELPIAPLNAVMQTRQGLGEQGETYLVGSDSRLRSDSVRFPELQVNRSLSPSTALTANAISRCGGIWATTNMMPPAIRLPWVMVSSTTSANSCSFEPK